MGTLTMALAAVLLAGNAPEKVSGETRQPLDLRGGWEGWWRDVKNQRLRIGVRIRSDRPDWITPGCGPGYPFALRDDGPGAFYGRLFGENVLGIFRQEGDRLTLCFREATKGRPTDFRDNGSQHLLVLYRVKPRK